MYELLWLVPTLPLLGFLVLAVFGMSLPRRVSAVIGVGSVGLAAVVSSLIAYRFIMAPPEGHAYTQVLWTWVDVMGFTPKIALYLDALSVVMLMVVTGVGFLIHVYSIAYMEDDECYAKFFAYMNLFVAMMLMLVLGDSLVLLYLGWEGVGLCSYLLIGFWYKNPVNGYAAIKAFLVTRIGDTAMAIGLFLLFWKLGTLDIQLLMARAHEQWAVGSGVAIAAALLILGGAVGKSGQLPLQVWLPDAMAGPTPVSALIHAATMVTAGVYLIARTYVLFELAPPVQNLVAWVGALTLLIAGFAALTQRDIKRVLAYSTISQIGYMFLALGVGAYSAGIFHLMTHAFFKALLFMAAGAIIVALHHEQDMFKMGGLYKKLPVVFWTFLIGSMSLMALPLITAGFYSKDLILWDVWTSPIGGKALWAAGYFGAFITGIYTTRMLVMTFFGEEKTHVHVKPGWVMTLPLVILAILATFGGFLEIPNSIYHLPLFTTFMQSAFGHPHEVAHEVESMEMVLQIITVITVFVGIGIGVVLFGVKPELVRNFVATPFGAKLHRFSFIGLGFDWVYDKVLIQPFLWTARVNKNDYIDSIYNGIAAACRGLHSLLSETESGHVRWYLMTVTAGAVIALMIVVFL